MAVVAPFKGLTYNYYVRQDFERIVAPPYDVISEAEQDEYYRTDPYNVIRLILGKHKTGDSDWDNQYTRAADEFKRWESAGILFGTDRPCMYLTSLTYNVGNGGGRKTRWGLIAVLRIEEADSGVILPHERTFSAHKDDRLKLMRACNAQLSQIFGLYEDADNLVLEMCKREIDFPPEVAFEFKDGTYHQMWLLQNPRLFRQVSEAMADKRVYIADGHHRYETARNYRNLMRARFGERPANRSYEFVMAYLTNLSDEGLTILPSHRMITSVPKTFDLDAFLQAVGSWFDIEAVSQTGGDPDSEVLHFQNRLREGCRVGTTIGVCLKDRPTGYIFSLKPDAREAMGRDLHPSLRKLDVLVLSRLILQRAVGFNQEDLDNEKLFHYESSMKKAITRVRQGDCRMAFLLNPTPMEQVKEIAGNGLVMPRKSTFFYPKILTGLVFNPIDPHEVIQVP